MISNINNIECCGNKDSTQANDKVSAAEIEVARKFEAIFLKQLMMSSKSQIDTEEMKKFKDMSLTETTNSMAMDGGIGLADMLINQWRMGR
jgi:Rod binding domain-containing protein